MNNIYINEEELTSIISKLNNKIESIKSIYKELDDKIKNTVDSKDIWDGEVQKKAYDKYLNLSNGFSNSINQMESLKIFLQNTLDNYINGDNSINNDIEKNSEDLSIN